MGVVQSVGNNLLITDGSLFLEVGTIFETNNSWGNISLKKEE